MNGSGAYIDVAVSLPVWRTYTYIVPSELRQHVMIGKRVLVPFNNRLVTGYVIGESSALENHDIKPVADVLDDHPLFHADHVKFFSWISTYYLFPMGEVIKSALPSGLDTRETTMVCITETGRKTIESGAPESAETDILTELLKGPRSKSSLQKLFHPPLKHSFFQSLERKNLILLNRELKHGRTAHKFETFVRLSDSFPDLTSVPPKKKSLVIELLDLGEAPVSELKKKIPGSTAHIKSLIKDGYIVPFEKKQHRDPFGDTISPDIRPHLTDEQMAVVSGVEPCIGNGFSPFLLMGVTGSGKTEVYMQLVQKTIEKGLTALVLVPEISLISQTERRFRMRFGDSIAVLHSSLTQGEKFDQWMMIAEKKIPIVIGARSAIFAPLESLGIIIVDEEHDTSYKQENGLRYNARDLAVVRAKLTGAVCLLGSATPSVQSYFNITAGKFRELILSKRVSERPLPSIRIVDLKTYRDYPGIRSFITPPLEEAMTRTLHNKEQILLFLNRRGYANYQVCATCGEPMKCISCDVSLTLHNSRNAYRCHMCNYIIPANSKCRTCNSSNIKNLGFGTERVEAAVKALFPEAVVARMDQDTTTHKGSIVKLLKGIKERKTDILIGTQMIAKGHDFPGITLVGIICADQSLNFPDFRACERTFQLLAQVAGRAGRGDMPGQVIMQTYNPDHFSILAAEKQDYLQFYQDEIQYREDLDYPPYSRMVQVRISGKDRRTVKEYAGSLGDEIIRYIRTSSPHYDTVGILGPIEAPIPKMADRYRFQILMKCKSQNLLHRLVSMIVKESLPVAKKEGIHITTDIDPYYLM